MTNIQIDPSESWRWLPHKYAAQVSGGRWSEYNHLQHIGRRVVKTVMTKNGRLIVNMPPRHGKSEFISYWTPTWYLDLWPTKRVVISSYDSDLATEFGRKVRNEANWNDDVRFSLRIDSKAANRWNTKAGGGMTAAGINSGLTGRGFDLGIIDDPFKDWKDSHSPAMRRRAVDWFESVFYTRREPGASIIVLMTRWHEDDLCGFLLNEHGDDWEHISLPGIAEANDPLGRDIGQALCPQRFDEADLLQTKRGMSANKWAALYDQRPAPEEGITFLRDWFKFYDGEPDVDFLIQTWDLSFDATSDSAYNVGQTWGVKWPNCYLIDQVRERLNFTGQIRAIKAFQEKYPSVTQILIEKAANGAAVITTLKDKIAGIIPIIAKDSKEMRAEAVSPMFEAGNIHLPQPYVKEWVKDYIEEFATFPNSKYKDQVDATTQALIRLQMNRPVDVIPVSMKKVSDFNL